MYNINRNMFAIPASPAAALVWPGLQCLRTECTYLNNEREGCTHCLVVLLTREVWR